MSSSAKASLALKILCSISCVPGGFVSPSRKGGGFFFLPWKTLEDGFWVMAIIKWQDQRTKVLPRTADYLAPVWCLILQV